MSESKTASVTEKIFTIFLIIFAIYMTIVAYGDKRGKQSLLDQIRAQQETITQKLDSVSEIAKAASDSAAAWRSVAQNLDSAANALTFELEQARKNRGEIKHSITQLPDSSLIRRYYISLYD